MAQTSLAKVEANRHNAMLSTGPKTQTGKQASKSNLLKHGLLSKEVVIRTGDARESKTDFDRLMVALVDDLRPECALEEMLVEKIAVCYWRLRRVIRCEAGEIHKETHSLEFDAVVKNIEEVNRLMGSDYAKRLEQTLVKTSPGVERMLRILKRLRDDIESDGAFSEIAEKEVAQVFGDEADDWGEALLDWNWAAGEEGQAKSKADGNDEVPSPDECRKRILEIIALKEDSLRIALDVMKEREKLELQSNLARLALPDEANAERILRYETAVERQLYRAISQLERLQSQRKGHIVPPPVSVEVVTE